MDKLTTEPGGCHCGGHKGSEVIPLRVVSKLVSLKAMQLFITNAPIHLRVWRCFAPIRDALGGCVHSKGILPERSFLRYLPPKKQTLASRVFHSVSRSCLAFLVVAVPTCQYTVKFVTLGQLHPKRESHIMLSQEIFKHRLFVHGSSSQNMASSAHVPTLP